MKEDRDRKNLVKATSAFFLTPKAVYLIAFNLLAKSDLVIESFFFFVNKCSSSSSFDLVCCFDCCISRSLSSGE